MLKITQSAWKRDVILNLREEDTQLKNEVRNLRKIHCSRLERKIVAEKVIFKMQYNGGSKFVLQG